MRQDCRKIKVVKNLLLYISVAALVIASLLFLFSCTSAVPIGQLTIYSLTITNDGTGTTDPTGTIEVQHGVATNIKAITNEIFGYENWFKEWSVVSGSGVTFQNVNSEITTVTLIEGDATIMASFNQQEVVFPSFTATPENKKVTLVWGSVSLAESYTLLYTTDGSTPTESGTRVEVTYVKSSYVLDGIENGYLYSFQIQANYSGKDPMLSGVEKAVPLSKMDLAPLLTEDYMQINVEWASIPASAHVDFEVLRSTEKYSGYTSVSGEISGTSYTDNDVEKGQGYFYKIGLALEGSIESYANFARPCPFPTKGSEVISYENTVDNALGITISGDYVYVGSKSVGLQVVYISDPLNPDIVDTCDTPGNARGVAVSVIDEIAYVADEGPGNVSGLQLIDISDPNDTSIIGSGCTTPGAAYNVAISGDYAYVADSIYGVQIIDINPSSGDYLTIVDNCDTATAFDEAMDVAVSGDYAFVAFGSSGLQVFDINPSSEDYLDVVGTYQTTGAANGIVLQGDYAYVAYSSSGLCIVDINPVQTTLPLASSCVTEYASDVALSGNYAFVTDSGATDRGLNVIDVTDPTTVSDLSLLSTIITPGSALQVAANEEYAFVADETQWLRVIDTSNPGWIDDGSIIGSSPVVNTAYGVTIHGGYAYVADGGFFSTDTGLQIVDLDTLSTVESGTATPGEARDVEVCGDYAFVADMEEGLQVIDINPSSADFLDIVASCDTPGNAYSVELKGSYAFVADGGYNNTSGLQVIDISVPTSVNSETSIVGACSTPDYAQDIAIKGDYAYVADADTGLHVIDISNPAGVTGDSLEKTCDTNYARGVAIGGNYAYVADADAGLQVIDISEPLLVGSTPDWTYDNGYGTDIAVCGGYAYIVDGVAIELEVIDISDPEGITGSSVLGTCGGLTGSAESVAVSGCNAYVADGTSGLQVVDLWPEE